MTNYYLQVGGGDWYSGTFSHGNSVTLTNGSFGTRTTLGYIWDDGSGNSNGDNAEDGPWVYQGHHALPDSYAEKYYTPANFLSTWSKSIAGPHSNINKYIAGCHYSDQGSAWATDVMFGQYFTVSSFPYKGYYSWYSRADPNFSHGGDDNYKVCIHAHTDGCGLPYGCDDGTDWPYWYLGPEDSPADGSFSDNDSGTLLNYNSTLLNGGCDDTPNVATQWVKKEVWYNIDYQETTITLWVEGSQGTGTLDSGSPNQVETATGLKMFTFGGYSRNYPTTANWRYYADMYWQPGSWARVVLTDNATYSSTTIREVQPITSWADGSISITVNEGALTGQTAYCHVVKEDGTAVYQGSVSL